MFAKVIAIDGPDSCGKQTQTKMLTHALKRYGAKTARIEIPFNDKFTHKLIYKMLYDGNAKKYPLIFQFVQFINKFICQSTYMLYKRLTCDYIILDRWKLSSYVYGTATNVNKFFLLLFYVLLASPVLTIILSGKSYNRSREKDSYEKDDILQSSVRNIYNDYAFSHPSDHVIVSNDDSKDVIHERILNLVNKLDEEV